MRIADEIALVESEFVDGDTFVTALATQEGIEKYQAASWLLRHIAGLDEIRMLLYNSDRRDFRFADAPWASDVLRDLVSGTEELTWTESDDGYIGGWLQSELEGLLRSLNVQFPSAEIAAIRAGLPVTDAPRRPSIAPQPDAGAVSNAESLGTRERSTLLTIIAALAEEAKISVLSASKSAAIVESIANRMGAPIGKRTIEEHLKRVPDALERRSR